MDFHIAEAHPRVMNSAEKNPEFWGVCSRTCLGVQQLQVISSSGSYHDAEGALELRKPGGVFNWIKKYCSRRCCDYTLPRNHIIPASVFPGISFLHRISAWHWFWVLLNSCSVPHLSGRPSILEKKNKPKTLNQKRVFYSPSMKHCPPHLSLQGSLRQVSLKMSEHVLLLFLPCSCSSKDSHPFPSHFLPFSEHCGSACVSPSAERQRGGEKSCCVFCQMEFGK